MNLRIMSLRTRRWVTGIAAIPVVLLGVGQILGCALTGKAEVVDVRYFEPEPPKVDSPSTSQGVTKNPPNGSDTAPLALQIGRVSASAYLKSRLVYRTSSYELGAYDDREWTERPEEYLRRSVSSAIFNNLGVTHALGGSTPSLDVELTNFEELRHDKTSTGRVTIRYSLRDDNSVWLSDSVTVEEPTKDGSQKPEAVVAAISLALSNASATIANKVEARLKQGLPKTVSTTD